MDKNDYIPIDIRKIKDKNRVYLSNDLIKMLGNPKRIIFSKINIDGDTKIILNDKENVIGVKIDSVKIDGKQRCTITKKIRKELGIDGNNNFVGFFLTNIKNNMKVIEIVNIANLGKKGGVNENI